jgi:hypothetical protein
MLVYFAISLILIKTLVLYFAGRKDSGRRKESGRERAQGRAAGQVRVPDQDRTEGGSHREHQVTIFFIRSAFVFRQLITSYYVSA